MGAVGTPLAGSGPVRGEQRYERDGPKPNAWRYRDYVVGAFNGQAHDQFIREQLAGDEMAGDSPSPAWEESAWRNAIIATGFTGCMSGMMNRTARWPRNTDDLDDILVTTSTAFLGLTLGYAGAMTTSSIPSASRTITRSELLRGWTPTASIRPGWRTRDRSH